MSNIDREALRRRMASVAADVRTLDLLHDVRMRREALAREWERADSDSSDARWRDCISAEATRAEDPLQPLARRRSALLQIAALAIAWTESLDRRGAGA